MPWLRKLWSPRRRIQLLLALPVLWFAAGAASAWIATMPWPKPIPARSDIAGRAVTEVAVTTNDGLVVRGWLARAAADSTRCVVLAAGIHGNRLAMLTRAEWYLSNGWSTLLVDLRGTGASDRARISMGYHEARDLLACRTWLRTQGFAIVGAHGQSLGAAAVVYGATDDQGPAWDFAVLESCYGDIDAALHNRLPWVPLPRLCLWPLRVCAEWFMQAEADQMRPVDAISSLRAPTLIICGDCDGEVGTGVSEALLQASGASQKTFVCVRGAGHVDLWPVADTLQEALTGFLGSLSR